MREPRGYHRPGRREVALGFASLVSGACGTAPSRLPSRPSSPPAGEGATPLAGTPEAPWGIQSGDVTSQRALVWSRADRPSRLVVEWSTTADMQHARRVIGAPVSPASDLTGKVLLEGLPAGTRVHYRARFEAEGASPWMAGELTTPLAPDARASGDVQVAWSGDTNGQGFGIDSSRGGMPAFKALLDRRPELFVSVGDAIYADNLIPPELPLLGGGVWRNLVTPAKSHVAETLDDFRGAYLYPRLSAEVRAFSAKVPQAMVWDDHEVRNNWFPGEELDDDRWTERRIDVLAARARQAMFEHAPVLDTSRIHRTLRWGPLLEIFLLDGRTFRTMNEPLPAEQRFLGPAQLAWLEDALTRSTAAWKVIASDMPVGLVVADAGKVVREAMDGFADGENGPPGGRELELAHLFTTLYDRRIRNVVFVTADVHYAAAHRYDPSRAKHRPMLPFWEFVAGPMHAVAFGQKRLDETFGPEVAYASPVPNAIGTPADPGTQSFGLLRIDGSTREMTVTLVDGRGRDLHTTRIAYQP